MDLQSQLKFLEEENKNLRAENQEKSDYLSMVVHQLRTPLAATKWIFKMMMDGDLGNVSESQKNIIKRGFENNESMIKMLADISTANHNSEWKLKLSLCPIDITECIDAIIGEFAGEAKIKNIILHFQKNTSLPKVLADKEKICLVLQNLVENAIKYNQVNGSITLTGEVFQNKVVVSISDTGMGIPQDDQKNIFGKFYRASNTHHEKGSGLGLFVGKQIIEAHHGTLWFESTPGIGTTFFFSLPLAL